MKKFKFNVDEQEREREWEAMNVKKLYYKFTFHKNKVRYKTDRGGYEANTFWYVVKN